MVGRPLLILSTMALVLWAATTTQAAEFGLAAALLAAGCSIKLPASSFAGFRVAPPTEFKRRGGDDPPGAKPGDSTAG